MPAEQTYPQHSVATISSSIVWSHHARMDNYSFESVPMSQANLTLHGPADLVAAVPHLLGFHPWSSLVVVFIESQDQHVTLTVRADLPGVTSASEYLQCWQQQLEAIGAAADASHVVLCAFPCRSADDVDAAVATALQREVLDVIQAVADLAERQGFFVYDQLLCWADRWRSLLCTDQSCCPDDGTPVDLARSDRIAAEFIAEAVSVQPDRASFAELLAPVPDDDPQAERFAALLQVHPMAAQADAGSVVSAQVRAQQAHECVETLLAGSEPSPVVALTLTDVRLRDAVIRMITHDHDAQQRRQAEQCLINTMKVCPSALRASVATVAAGLAWQRGDGATAGHCLDVALTADSNYSLARLLQRALRSAVPPAVWVSAVGQTTMQECLNGTSST